MAPTQRNAYHHGQRPGASQTTGASTAAIVAANGATHGGSPRRGPSSAAPAAVPASSTETAARKSGTSQISQSDASTPCGGI